MWSSFFERKKTAGSYQIHDPISMILIHTPHVHDLDIPATMSNMLCFKNVYGLI